VFYLWPERSYGAGVQIKKLDPDESVHRNVVTDSETPSSVSVLVSRSVSISSPDSSIDKPNRALTYSSAEIDVGHSAEGSSSDQ